MSDELKEVRRKMEENKEERIKQRKAWDVLHEKNLNLVTEFNELEDRERQIVEGFAEWTLHIYSEGELTIQECDSKDNALIVLASIARSNCMSNWRALREGAYLFHNGTEVECELCAVLKGK